MTLFGFPMGMVQDIFLSVRLSKVLTTNKIYNYYVWNSINFQYSGPDARVTP